MQKRKFDLNTPHIHFMKPIIGTLRVILCGTPFISFYILKESLEDQISMMQTSNLWVELHTFYPLSITETVGMGLLIMYYVCRKVGKESFFSKGFYTSAWAAV